jgi:cytoskeletal protein RodZ
MSEILIKCLIVFFLSLIFYQVYLTSHPTVEGFANKKSNKDSKSDTSNSDTNKNSNEESTTSVSSSDSSSVIIINSQIKDINKDIFTMKADIGELKENVIVLNDQIKAMNSAHNDEIQNISSANLTVDSAIS